MEIIKGVLCLSFTIFTIVGAIILMNCILFKWPRVCSV